MLFDFRKKIGDLSTTFTGEIADLKLTMAQGYVAKDDCNSYKAENTETHKDLYNKTDDDRKDIERMKGRLKINGGT